MEPITHCEKYDIQIDMWHSIPNLNQPKGFLSSCALGGFIYTFGGGGINGLLLDTIECFSVNQGQEWLELEIQQCSGRVCPILGFVN
jgi:hypothetical protein